MVKYLGPDLDATFAALSDPTRRALLVALKGRESASVGELASRIPMSLPAVLKHLDALVAAGLVTRAKSGRVVSCRLHRAPLGHAMAWLERL